MNMICHRALRFAAAQRVALCWFVFLALAVALPASAFAQADARLDDARFIQGLRERGMKELLLYYLEKNPPEDEVTRLEIAIEQHRLIFEDEDESAKKRQDAALDVVDAYRKLIDEAPVTHWKQPIWKTDMAAFIIEQVLPVRYVNAGAFVEFGDPTMDQRREFDKLASEAAEMMELAGDDHFRLVGDLPRRENFEIEFVNSGRWRQIKEELGELRLPFYRGWAFFYNALTTPAKNKAERLGQAKLDLQKILDGDTLSDAGQATARSLLGRVSLAQEKYDVALKQLNEAAKKAPEESLDAMRIQLARAQALARSKKQDEALEILKTVQTTPPATRSPILLVLAYDAEFKITDNQSVYVRLFNAPEAAQWKAMIENYVSERMVAKSGDEPKDPQSLAAKPPLEVLANVDAMVANAQQIKGQLEGAAGQEAEKLKAQGAKLYESAVNTLKKFLEREDLDEATRAQAMFKLGVANFQRGRNFDAAQALVELAEQFPKQPQAEQAAQYGAQLMQEIYRQFKDNDKAVDYYRRALQVLLREFPDNQVAKNMRYAYAAFLREQKQYEKAIEAYAQIDKSHPFYIDSLYEALSARVEVWRTVEPKKKQAAADEVIRFADQVLATFQQAIGQVQGERREQLLYKQGDATLMKVEVLAESGQAAKAHNTLEGYDQTYSQFENLISAKRQIAISILVQMGRVQEALDEISAYIQKHPNEGGPMIKGVLDKVNAMTRDARLRNAPDQARQLATTGIQLGEFLVNWARKQPQFANDPKKMIFFRDVLGEQYVNAEQYDKAFELYDKMFKTPEGEESLPVIFGMARTLYHKGDYEKAMPLCNKILNKAPDQASPVVWETWVMRLDMLDKQRQQLADAGKNDEADKKRRTIFTTILKLKMFDPDLGGSRFKSDLQRLELRNQPQ